VIELRALIFDGGPLSEFFLHPPEYLSPQNGVTGIALSYNAIFVDDVSRNMRYFPVEEGSVEFSARVAATLAAVARDITRSDSADIRRLDYELFYGYGLLRRWRDLTERRFGRPMSPIEIEVNVSPGFPLKTGGGRVEVIDHVQDFPLVFRSAPPARLHFASSGGRFVPHGINEGDLRWGTLGGFLTHPTGGSAYAVTADHVLPSGCTHALGTLAFETAANFRVGHFLQRAALANILPRRWRPSEGHIVHRSPPDIVAANQCSAHINPASVGLDLALAEWKRNDAQRILARPVALGETSQALTGHFVGARSGSVKVRVVCYSIWQAYQLYGTGSEVACIADCLQIALARRPYVWTDVSRPGDSGSWVISDSRHGAQWLGVLVGGDGERSGVVPAHRIVDHLAPTYGALIPMI